MGIGSHGKKQWRRVQMWQGSLDNMRPIERILLSLTSSYLFFLERKCIWHMFGPYLSPWLQIQTKHCKLINIYKVKDVEDKEKGVHKQHQWGWGPQQSQDGNAVGEYREKQEVICRSSSIALFLFIVVITTITIQASARRSTNNREWIHLKTSL